MDGCKNNNSQRSVELETKTRKFDKEKNNERESTS